MQNHENLIRALTQLDPASLEEVVTAAYRQRNDSQPDLAIRPDSQATSEQFAHWLARRHLSTDAALERIVYLPTGAPENEIRLLEVNRFLNQSDTETIEPLDFTPEMGLPFRVFVADITTDQWDLVRRKGNSVLPSGWLFEDNQIIGRG